MTKLNFQILEIKKTRIEKRNRRSVDWTVNQRLKDQIKKRQTKRSEVSDKQNSSNRRSKKHESRRYKNKDTKKLEDQEGQRSIRFKINRFRSPRSERNQEDS